MSKVQIIIPEFNSVPILVVGDVMLDRYWFGATERISPEAPVPVVHVGESRECPGGAANVAVNLAALGAEPTLLGLVGDDPEAQRLIALVESAQIEPRLLACPQRATVTKLRVLSRQQQLIRLDFEQGFSAAAAARLRQRFQQLLAGHAAVIASDYGKGALAEIPQLIDLARRSGIPLFVDPKGRDFDRYRGAWAITPNRHEFEAVVGPCGDDAQLVERGEVLRSHLDLTALLVTRGAEGMTLISAGRPALHLPTHAREVADVTGAGDTVIAAFATGIAWGLEPAQAAGLANVAAGVVVTKVGAASVTPAELKRAAHRFDRGGMDEPTLLELVAAARVRDERIVMTNGCFDLLHAGHVRYLSAARALGDRLIVAVNDDASVHRLKGRGRPLVPLEDRMAVLDALECVDWVVPFSEDDPGRLIAAVTPDVLVKGGDYRIEEIAGGEAVVAGGGEVRVLPLLEGRSTSALVTRIREGK